MAIDEKDIAGVERAALEHMVDEGDGHLEERIDAEAEAVVQELERNPEGLQSRAALAVALTVIAGGVMTGGIFLGIAPRFYASLAGLLGVGLALAASRVRNVAAVYVLTVVGIFFIGIILLLPDGVSAVANIRSEVSQSLASGKVLRPPVSFNPGWTAVLSWIMAAVGFGAAWVAISVKKVAIGVFLPLPLAAIAGISITEHTAQIVSGIAVLILFGAALGVLSGDRAAGDEQFGRGYELRRALKAVPVMAAITALLFVLAQTNFLFPHPIIDPTQEPQKPKPVPLGAANDRVLFTASPAAGSSSLDVTGPWVLGHLDVYDNQDWRLPPFASHRLTAVPKDGKIDRGLTPGVKVKLTVHGLDGTVLPGIPSMALVVASGPSITYDSRSGVLRLVEGQVQEGFTYSLAAASIPTVDSLKALGAGVNFPSDVRPFTQIGPPPAAVQALIKQAPTTTKWEQYDFLRTYVLQNVTASGSGTPVSVTPARVNEMLSTHKEGSPFEIVAAQAMLARWVGIPSRIGYGFDGGDKKGQTLEVHPRNGVAFPEVYFPQYKWLPIIGTPVHAKVTQGGSNNIQQNIAALPSDDISVPVYVPKLFNVDQPLYQQLQQVALVVLPLVAVLALLYYLYPVVVKAIRRARSRALARAAGPRARVALAYAEWRDYATDFGYRHPSDTPLSFLNRFVEDEEHTEFAWLVTRCLWGDLRSSISNEVASDAEELSRTLRRRLANSQTITVRAVALVSRLSLRYPHDTGFSGTGSQDRAKKEMSGAAYA